MALEEEFVEVRDQVDTLEDAIVSLSNQITAFQTALTAEGEPNIVNLPHTIKSGHNMFGYTGSNGIDIVEAFLAATGNVAESVSIIDRISIVKNEDGVIWSPANDFNGIGSMVYGQGYYLYNTGEPFSVTWI